MELNVNVTYKIIGKVESINHGAHFCNTTVLTIESEHINLKLDFEQLPLLSMGKVYEFQAQAIVKIEDELILKCLSFTPAEEVLSDEELAKVLERFYVYAPIPMMQIKKGIESYLNKIENEILKKITKKIYKENEKLFYMHPAATKFHHSYVGGLSHHTYTMLKLIDPFISIYPYLNKDLLYSGTILHDMSKISEISGVDGEYTKEGLLIGHLVMQTVDIDRVARELGFEKTEEVLMLKHMIISHHGQYNFGSPKKPQTGEALLLWFIDTIDSKFTVLGETLEDTADGVFTQMISVMDKTRFYKHKIK
ncbi:MAG: metal-dependent phosphohydrolase [Acholeplasmataceae bacterium]|nr:metal-dependent phosphohydrolase [Acholeplasmataceae bacterium]